MFGRWSAAVRRVTASRLFLYGVFGWFITGAVSIAITSHYPMAFDENWHLGLIQIYAKHWLPFDIQKTPDMAALGDATSDPSYLFHYLMSFPYRLMVALNWNQTAIIIVLRLIDVGLFTASLILFWKTLRMLGLSRARANAVIAMLSLIPIAPLLAAQINYDNLLLVFVAGLFLLTVTITKLLWKKKVIQLTHLYIFIIIALFGSATKYAFMPLVLVSALWILFWAVQKHVGWHPLWRQLRTLTIRKHIVLLLLVVIGGTLLSRDVYNLSAYHKLSPPCDYFFSISECEAYGPWERDRELKEEKPILHPGFVPQSYPEYMVLQWIPGMTMRLFFVVSGPNDGYISEGPLPVVLALYIVICSAATIGFIWNFMRLVRQNPLMWYVLATITVYVLSLSIEVYGSYVSTAEPVAINGRYLLPLAALIGFILMEGLVGLASRLRFNRYLPLVGAVLLIILAVQGGGALTYFGLAQSSWFWPGVAQQVTAPISVVMTHITPVSWPWQQT